ncbi:MAG TPA: RNA pseudouridine synthase [Falsiroseomonas sp.]|jgi:RluA family pseudouridine synthase|nr:RNA pseudouridine synthase [Falsiroseomonas sp.]
MRRKLPAHAAPRQAEIAAPAWLMARVLHLDQEVLVLDKPAGLPVSARTGESLEAWLPALRLGKRRDPQPAHRLDADTSGCLVLGRTAPMLARINALFAERRVEKVYWAVLRGVLREPDGVVVAPLRKVSSAARGWRMEVHPAGDPARTAWRVLGRAPGLTWVELRPETGRTHQLRVHCAHLGAPILGDAMYGGGDAGGLHLLARAIGLPLDPPLRVTAPVPAHMRPAIGACGGDAQH